jgi:hypothetical protein
MGKAKIFGGTSKNLRAGGVWTSRSVARHRPLYAVQAQSRGGQQGTVQSQCREGVGTTYLVMAAVSVVCRRAAWMKKHDRRNVSV